jgi:CDP-diacylglycerol--serine O-phosphatidyltransferase
LTVTDPETQSERSSWVSDLEDGVADLPLSTRLSIADALTLGNAICGFMAVYFTTTGVLVPHLMGTGDGGMSKHSAANAVTLMLLASVFDLFDGLVARKLRSSAMGAELDNLSDLISFGLAPAYFVIVWGIVSDDGHGKVAASAAALVVLAVVLRLARFSCTTLRDGVFPGLPSPFGAMTVVSLVLLALPFVPTIAAIDGVAWLMVSRVEYPSRAGASPW